MENYDRYKMETTESCEKKNVMDYLVRIPSDKRIIPLINRLKGKRILDVGLGTGLYTRLLLKDNEVVGVDQNPHLCRLPIKVYGSDATRLVELVGAERFDVVFSTWMTEYLSGEQLSIFFSEARKVLAEEGQLMITIISKYGFGFLYVAAAKLIRGIHKYNYTKRSVMNMLKEAGFSDIEFINLNSWLSFPWAYMAIAKV
jgi:cyclopropane fatty-acyl-phospholipid synthase-like methyltransferase